MQVMQELVERLGGQLVLSGWRVATAESCTGGMIAEQLTEIPGSSNFFDRSYITYSNKSKSEMLGVAEDEITAHGAVSAQVAQAMLEGVFKKSKVDIAISATGIAGPQGGTAEKPVGLVYLGTGMRGRKPIITKNYFTGDRETIRQKATEAALSQLLMLITDPT